MVAFAKAWRGVVGCVNRHVWVDKSVEETVKVYEYMQLVTGHAVPICL